MRKLIVNVVIIVVLVLMPVLQGGPQRFALAKADAFSISGRVMDELGNGIPGVTVLAALINYNYYFPNVNSSNTNYQPPQNPPSSSQNFYTTQTDSIGGYTFA